MNNPNYQYAMPYPNQNFQPNQVEPQSYPIQPMKPGQISDYEEENVLYELFSLITPKLGEMLGCKGVLTKAPVYAVERIEAIKKAGYTKSEHMLIGKTGYAYDGYWTIK